MRKTFWLAGICAFISLQSQAQSTNKLSKPLFDGKSLQGWKQIGGDARYTIEDETIVGTMVKKTPNSFLVTEKEYGDFILELDFKIEGTTTNSGVQIRSHYDPQADKGKGRVFGKQVEIDPSTRAWTGGIYDEARRGWLYPLDNNDPAKKAFKNDQFNQLRIEAIGDEVRTWINGIPTSVVIDTIDRTGILALQVHAVSDDLDGKRVFFKNINIQTKKLAFTKLPKDVPIVNLTPNKLSNSEKADGIKLLFDGETAKGWRSAKTNSFPAKGWNISNGTINVLKSTGGESVNGGDIITNKQYETFDLSFEFKLTEGANSGVKYFVTLKEQSNGSAIGLEFQILDDAKHPDAKLGKDGNRTLASLYDLITSNKEPRARRAIGEWNRGRIVVTKNQVTHYLNGIKMLSYDRHSNEFKKLVEGSKYKNWPNFGQAKKGHILLQDHGDAVSFRNIKLKELK